MGKEICTVCGRPIDSRGMSGHMRTHKGKPKKSDTDGGVISYPSNEQKIENETQIKQPVLQDAPRKPARKVPSKPVKKPVASSSASSPQDTPQDTPQDIPQNKDPRGQRNSGSKKNAGHPKDSGVTKMEHKTEWQGLFRD